MPARNAILVFGTGEMAVVESYNVVHENGKEYYEIRMELTPHAMKTHKINPDRLDYSNPEFFRGLLTKRYLATYIVFLTNSPENPVWFAACSFDGSPLDIKGTKIEWIVRQRDQLESAKEEATMWKGAYEDKEDELRMATTQIQKWAKRKGLIFDSSDKISDMVAKIVAMQKRST